ncbi:MAG: metallophosphoesterase [Clostridiales bacterium]
MRKQSLRIILILILFILFYFKNIYNNNNEYNKTKNKYYQSSIEVENNNTEIVFLDKKVKIMVVSDLHYFPFEYTSETDEYKENVPNNRKLIKESEAINNEMKNRIIKSDVDLVFLTGDLTKDGERQSHLEFAKILNEIENSGKKVFVVPGNHDINGSNAVKFEGENQIDVDTVSAEEFKKIYKNFGYDEAISIDKNSISYMVEPVKGMKLIAIDSCIYGINDEGMFSETGGSVDEIKLKWIKEQIKNIDPNKELILSIMHHNLIEHFENQDKYFEGYVVEESESIKNKFADMGIRVVFTGHFHISDIAVNITNKGNSIYDVETGSIITYPCPYRIIEIDKNIMNISTERIDYVDFYGINYDFQKYSYEFLLDGLGVLIHKMFKEYIKDKKLDTEDVDYLMNINITKDYTAEKIFTEAMMENYCGDEKISENQKFVIDKLLNSDLKIYKLIGEITKSLFEDNLPEDNTIKIYLDKVNE